LEFRRVLFRSCLDTARTMEPSNTLMTRSRPTTWWAVAMWTLALSLWVAGLGLWLRSVSRHMPSRDGPVAASVVSSDVHVVVDGASLEVMFATVFLVVASVGALI